MSARSLLRTSYVVGEYLFDISKLNTWVLRLLMSWRASLSFSSITPAFSVQLFSECTRPQLTRPWSRLPEFP